MNLLFAFCLFTATRGENARGIIGLINVRRVRLLEGNLLKNSRRVFNFQVEMEMAGVCVCPYEVFMQRRFFQLNNLNSQ